MFESHCYCLTETFTGHTTVCPEGGRNRSGVLPQQGSEEQGASKLERDTASEVQGQSMKRVPQRLFPQRGGRWRVLVCFLQSVEGRSIGEGSFPFRDRERERAL